MELKKKPLLAQIQLMMHGLGIPCSLQDGLSHLNGKDFPRSILRVLAPGAKRFSDLIGFTETHKMERLRKLSNSPKHEKTLWPIGELYYSVFSRYNQGSFPVKCVKAARVAKEGRVHIPQGPLNSLLKCLSEVPSGDIELDTLRQIKGFYPQVVSSIEPFGASNIFDLEVSGDHEYTTGGILTHNCERSADIVTTTYLSEDHRRAGTTLFDCLKRRDGALFEPFIAKVNWPTRRILNYDIYQGSQNNGLTVEDGKNIQDLMFQIQV
jgi:hypothetical protein